MAWIGATWALVRLLFRDDTAGLRVLPQEYVGAVESVGGSSDGPGAYSSPGGLHRR